MDSAETVISIRELTKRYGSKTALDKLSLDLKKGRIYALVGRDGSGKTTLLSILAGFALRYEGTIELLGRSDKRGLHRARKSVGAFVDDPALFDELSIGDNLSVRGMLVGKNDKEQIKELRSSLRLRNSDVGKRGTRSATLGVKQLTGIAAAMIGDPEILLLDEPLSGLDVDGVEDTRGLLTRTNAEKGVTVLATARTLTELYGLATDYIFIDEGKLVEQMTAGELDAKLAERGLEEPEAYFDEIAPEKPKRRGVMR